MWIELSICKRKTILIKQVLLNILSDNKEGTLKRVFLGDKPLSSRIFPYFLAPF